jgi:hypothetical protein
MVTNLSRQIESIEEAKAFLAELIENKEVYHPEDDAHDIEWFLAGENPTSEECDQLNRLMAKTFEFEGFDPCQYVLENSEF